MNSPPIFAIINLLIKHDAGFMYEMNEKNLYKSYKYVCTCNAFLLGQMTIYHCTVNILVFLEE